MYILNTKEHTDFNETLFISIINWKYITNNFYSWKPCLSSLFRRPPAVLPNFQNEHLCVRHTSFPALQKRIV